VSWPKLLTISAALTLGVAAGCASPSPTLWTKPGANDDEFARDRYTCAQEAQVPYTRAYQNAYGGAVNQGVKTDVGIFKICLEAHGRRQWARGCCGPNTSKARVARTGRLTGHPGAHRRSEGLAVKGAVRSCAAGQPRGLPGCYEAHLSDVPSRAVGRHGIRPHQPGDDLQRHVLARHHRSPNAATVKA
jgi:hypothetical protein